MGGSSGTECIVRKPRGKRPVKKPRHRWEAKIETDLKNRIQVWNILILLRIETQ